ncbi:MAG: YVTN family beta-propeller domain-containing protein [Lysobacterales bacterium 14-68-21]|jgi:DNA-binding beta-propeller fold protein YncE|nr:MAG: YVTN family beta-propeller domain-containing protein [Xanthomonadales bacterium 15-68-25]OZB65645.1 MAG: YVTN family beta-propeller domain-containing protein [Xanthomonadales bacterium 14-68-21]
MSTLPRTALALLLAGVLAPAYAAGTAPAKPLHVVDRLALGGPGGWDYLAVDAPRHHLFVSRGDRVMVVDLATRKLVGTITGTDGVHGIAFDPARKEGFTSDGHAASVTVFDLDTLKVLATIRGTGENPDAIAFDPASGRVFTLNGRGHSASVIDPAKRAVVATIALPGKPEFAVADGNGRLYVNIEDKSELAEIDTGSDKLLRTWSLAPCESPSGLAFDAAHRRAFSVCDNRVMAVSDVDHGRVVTTVPIGEGPDAAVFDPSTHTVYSSNGQSGTLTVVHQVDADHYTVAATVPTQKSARTMALDPTTQRLYLSAATLGSKRNARGWSIAEPGSFVVLEVAH